MTDYSLQTSAPRMLDVIFVAAVEPLATSLCLPSFKAVSIKILQARFQKQLSCVILSYCERHLLPLRISFLA